MRTARIIAIFTTLALLAACNKDAAATGGSGNANVGTVSSELATLLTTVKDGPTAEAAKTKLNTLTDSLSSALTSLKSAGANAEKSVSGAVDMAKKAAEAVTPEMKTALSSITTEVTRLLALPEVTKVIGPVLEKLKALIPA